jgi:hypothetical protein
MAIASWLHLGRSALEAGMLPSAAKSVARRLRSNVEAVGLRRDLAVPFEAPRAAIPIEVRPLAERDVPHLLEPNVARLSAEERWDRASRKRLLEAGFGTPHVAVTDGDVPCHIHWLFGHRDNECLSKYFHGGFPLLALDEALLEGGFTPAAFRGKRIMSAAMASIAERGTDLGARWVLGFVGTGNTASLKGCARAGFSPYSRRLQEWRVFRCRTSFHPLDRLGGAASTSAAR